MEYKFDRKAKYIGLGLLGILLYFSRKKLFEHIFHFISFKLTTYASTYRKTFRPKRIILIRHGQSEANINPAIYDTVPDNKISLSELGFQQAREVAVKLKDIVKEESMLFFVSPLIRTRQTAEEISKSFKKDQFKIYIDPRLREQEWGNFQNQQKMNHLFQIRNQVGKFYYRFSEGESGADVYDRASAFLESLHREMDDLSKKKQETYVIITHGLFMRLFIMRYFKMSIEKFEKMSNPQNCEMWVMERNKQGKYELKTEIKQEK